MQQATTTIAATVRGGGGRGAQGGTNTDFDQTRSDLADGVARCQCD